MTKMAVLHLPSRYEASSYHASCKTDILGKTLTNITTNTFLPFTAHALRRKRRKSDDYARHSRSPPPSRASSDTMCFPIQALAARCHEAVMRSHLFVPYQPICPTTQPSRSPETNHPAPPPPTSKRKPLISFAVCSSTSLVHSPNPTVRTHHGVWQ